MEIPIIIFALAALLSAYKIFLCKGEHIEFKTRKYVNPSGQLIELNTDRDD